MEILLSDRPYYEATGGGVTFSGGECMLHPKFLASMAKRCREKGIHVAVDTAGHVPFSSFESLLPLVDLFLYDVKAIDPQLHMLGTGVSNALILENLRRLVSLGANLLVRIPCIPNFNAGEELSRAEAFCRSLALPYEILPYHALGESKKTALSQ